MIDINKVIDNPNTNDPERVEHELDLQDWNEDKGHENAKHEGIELTREHWDVIHCLREYYIEHGPAKNGRELGDMLDDKYEEQGGRKFLYRLFPQGPVAQGMRILGLNLPPHTEDGGFGTSQ